MNVIYLSTISQERISNSRSVLRLVLQGVVVCRGCVDSLTYLREELRSRPEGWRAEERVNSVSEHLKQLQYQLKPVTDVGASSPSPPGPNPAEFSILMGRKPFSPRTVANALPGGEKPGWIQPSGTGFGHPYSQRTPRFHE